MKKLITRAITGIVLVVVMLTSILVSEYSFAVLFLFILTTSIFEFNHLFKQSEIKPNQTLSYITSAVLFVLSFLSAKGSIEHRYIWSILPFLLAVMASELYRKKTRPVENIAIAILSITYIALPISLINFIVFPNFLKNSTYSPQLLIAIFSLIWIYDSGAYLVGVSIGRHRLFERISPKKSWEGAIGGTIFAIVASYFISGIIPEIKMVHWFAISVVLVISATFGDLTESMFKRYFGIKDSSHILPGHGGMLDRFDSLFFVVPAIFAYIKVFIG